MVKPGSFDHLLHLAREAIISNAAVLLTNKFLMPEGLQVHAANYFVNLAYQLNLGVRPRLLADPIRMRLAEEPRVSLYPVFRTIFTPFAVIKLIFIELEKLLLDVGYIGPKSGFLSEAEDNLSSVTYDKGEMDAIFNLLRNFNIPISKADLFITEIASDEITQYIRDINVNKIYRAIVKKLIEDKYFEEKPLPCNYDECIDFLDKIEKSDLVFSKLINEFIEEKFFNKIISLNKNHPELLNDIIRHPLITSEKLFEKISSQKENIDLFIDASLILMSICPEKALSAIMRKLSVTVNEENGWGKIVILLCLSRNPEANDANRLHTLHKAADFLTVLVKNSHLNSDLIALYGGLSGLTNNYKNISIIANTFLSATQHVEIICKTTEILVMLAVKASSMNLHSLLLDGLLGVPSTWFYISYGLYQSIDKNNIYIALKIISILNIFMKKLSSSPENLSKIVKGLSESVASGKNEKDFRNGLFFIITALYLSMKNKNFYVFQSLSEILDTFVRKCFSENMDLSPLFQKIDIEHPIFIKGFNIYIKENLKEGRALLIDMIKSRYSLGIFMLEIADPVTKKFLNACMEPNACAFFQSQKLEVASATSVGHAP